MLAYEAPTLLGNVLKIRQVRSEPEGDWVDVLLVQLFGSSSFYEIGSFEI